MPVLLIYLKVWICCEFYQMNVRFHAWAENNISYCTLCSLLGSCISFVMKSWERANFKLISLTQRAPITRDARKTETNRKISVDKFNPSSSTNKIHKTVSTVVVIALVWIALCFSALLCFNKFELVQYSALLRPFSILFHSALFVFCYIQSTAGLLTVAQTSPTLQHHSLA